MAPDAVGALQSRVAQLEEEIATVVAQVGESPATPLLIWPACVLRPAMHADVSLTAYRCVYHTTQAEAAAISAEQASQVRPRSRGPAPGWLAV